MEALEQRVMLSGDLVVYEFDVLWGPEPDDEQIDYCVQVDYAPEHARDFFGEGDATLSITISDLPAHSFVSAEVELHHAAMDVHPEDVFFLMVQGVAEPLDSSEGGDLGASDVHMSGWAYHVANSVTIQIVASGLDDQLGDQWSVEWIRISVTPGVHSLSYGGSGFHEVHRDDGSGAYQSPQWMHGALLTECCPLEDRENPVAYVRDSIMEVSAVFGVPAHITAQHGYVRGTGPGGINFPAEQVNIGGGIMSVSGLEADTELPDQIHYYENFVIDWEIDWGEGWVSVGSTSNPVYVLLDEPISTLYHTVVHVGTQAAHGKTTIGGALDAIWDEFESRNMSRVDEVPMIYNHDVDTSIDMEGMLAHSEGKGQCTAWAELLVAMLGAHGIEATSIRIDPADGFNRFRVREMPAQGTGEENYLPGTTGVGFSFHQVVRVTGYANRIYDPSYGTLTVADHRSVELRWEDENCTHHVLVGAAPTFTILDVEEDEKGVLELNFE